MYIDIYHKKMKKAILFFPYILLFLTTCSSQEKRQWNYLTICEDEIMEAKIKYTSTADISQSDWLQVIIKNKSNKDIELNDVGYSINYYSKSNNGKTHLNIGGYSQGNKFDLLHFIYFGPNPSDYRNPIIIFPKDSLVSYDYTTNYTSVLIEEKEKEESEICALFQFYIEYKLNKAGGEIKLDTEKWGKEFCFVWNDSYGVPPAKLKERLLAAISSIQCRANNGYIVSELMKDEILVKKISTDEFIQAVLKNKKCGSHKPVLIELGKRNAIPNKLLTEYNYEKLIDKQPGNFPDLLNYWDNALFDELLSSRIAWNQLPVVLEHNSDEWAIDEENKDKAYEALKIKVRFDPELEINKDNIKKWAEKIKLMAVCRSDKIIQYLLPYLKDKTTYEMEDWSKYSGYGALPKGAKPDLISIRICDIAFVAILRALDQINLIGRTGGVFPALIFKYDILSKEYIEVNDLNRLRKNVDMLYYEKAIILNDEFHKKIDQLIANG